MENLPSDFFLTNFQFTRQNRLGTYSSVDPTNPSNSLAGKVVIITGASRGLGGRGLVPIFAKAGAKALVLVATNADKLKLVEKAVEEQHPEIETLAVAVDVSEPASVASLFEQIKAKFGHADVLVNNAAIRSSGGVIHEEDPLSWWKNFQVNTLGSFLLIQSFIRALPDATSTPASIVNITTGGAWGVYPAMSGYAISKLAALQLVTYIGTAYPNITAISLHPGLMETDMIDDSFRNFHTDTPDFVASVALWMTSEQAKFMSGRVMTVNWDVDELVQRKGEIVEKDVLKIKLGASLGPAQFE